MTDIHFLLGEAQGTTLDDALSRASRQPAWKPFDRRAIDFIARFSQKLLTHPSIRAWPELAALGHWFRRARLQELAGSLSAPNDAVLRGRGLAFHLAPANVDSVSMYSWLLALLAGNCNWVRVSQKASAQLDFVIDILREVLGEDVGAPVRGRIVLLTYAHDDQMTRRISEAAALRVVWGGDATVRAIRAIPLRPTAMEICFPDRFSAAALQAASLLAWDASAWARLAANFYNDAFWFAQQACSSPRLLSWVGSESDCREARARFWQAVEAEVARRQPENSPAMAMARLATAFELAGQAAAHPGDGSELGHFPMRVAIERPLDAGMRDLHCGNGLFLEQRVDHLRQLAEQMTDKEQTLSVAGFSRAELLDFIDALPPRAVDRIVLTGEALTFSPVWDGTALLQLFTRQIALPPDRVAHATGGCP
jgi:hypothetical protein